MSASPHLSLRDVLDLCRSRVSASMQGPASLCFPLLVCAALAALGLSSPTGFAAPLVGTLSLCFAYVGLTQPPGTSVLVLPFGSAALVCMYGGVNGPVTVRLVIALFVWSLLGELLARLMRRQVALSATLVGDAHRDELTGVPNRRDLGLRLTMIVRLQDQWATLQPAVTFSAGVATCTSDRSVSETLAAADAMLYAAKTSGRNQVLTEHVPALVAGRR